jgi:hypothetical protein
MRLPVTIAVLSALALPLGCKGAGGPTGPLTDDPRTEACQRGALVDGQNRISSLETGDCRFTSDALLAEVWTVTVPTQAVAGVRLTAAFEGELQVYDTSGSLLGYSADAYGEAHIAVIEDPGTYLVVVTTFETGESGSYSIVAKIGPLGLNGTYTGTADGVYGSVVISTGITLSLSTSGSNLGGTWATSPGATTALAGTLNGTVSGNTTAFTLSQNVPCAGTYTGDGTIQFAGFYVAASFYGTDCNATASLGFVAKLP